MHTSCQNYRHQTVGFNRHSRTVSDKKKAGTFAIARVSGLYRMPLDGLLVEVAGVEPASEGA